MRKEKHFDFLKAVGWSLFALSLLLGLWMLISYVDVITHNMIYQKNYGEFLPWNWFIVMENLFEAVR